MRERLHLGAQRERGRVVAGGAGQARARRLQQRGQHAAARVQVGQQRRAAHRAREDHQPLLDITPPERRAERSVTRLQHVDPAFLTLPLRTYDTTFAHFVFSLLLSE